MSVLDVFTVPKKENIGGRPSYQPTEADRNTVKTMAACGIPHDAIARCLGTNGIAPKTLRRHFRHELDTSLTQVNALVGSQVIAAVKRGEAWACCFWLKCRGGWKERQGIEHSGPDSEPLHIKVTGIQPTEENT
jgi:hypothetical protein